MSKRAEFNVKFAEAVFASVAFIASIAISVAMHS